MYLDFPQKFRAIHRLDEWTIESLSDCFQVPEKNFAEVAPGIIMVISKYSEKLIGYLLRGSLFFPEQRYALRGMPKIMYGQIYQATTPAAVTAERELLSCLKNEKILFEEKLDGVNIRMYRVQSKYYFATRMRYDGLSEKSEFPFGEMARNMIEKKYPGAFKMVDAGYVPIFEMLSPKFEYLSLKAKEDDMVMIDLLKDNQFLRRERKEELANEYGLKIPKIISTIERSMTPKQFLKEIKSLEYYSHQLGLEGVVAKAFSGDSDQAFLKVKTQDIRSEHWGTMGIPKRFILEVARSMKAEHAREEFINREFMLPKIIDELSDDFLISEKNLPKIEQYYEEVRSHVADEVEAMARARELFDKHQFKSRKDIALATRTEEKLVRHFLFKQWEERGH